MIRRILNDFGSAALAIALAVTIWVVATNEQNPSIRDAFPENIPVQVLNMPDGMVVFPEIVKNVSITVRAPQTSWDRLGAEKFEALVDLEGCPLGGTMSRSRSLAAIGSSTSWRSSRLRSARDWKSIWKKS